MKRTLYKFITKGKLIFICFLALLLSSCCEAIITFTKIFKNTTTAIVEIKTYEKGVTESMKVNGLSTIKSPLLLDLKDSIEVLYDNVLITVHYPSNTSSTTITSKTIRFSQPGNLFNLSNYTTEKKDLPCNGSNTESTYFFK